jgi:hypothetical protein
MATSDRFLVGYAATFDSTTEIRFEGAPFTESIAPGAFSFVLGESRPGRMAVFNRDHEVGRLLGRNGKNLTLNEDEVGLHFRLRLPDTELGNDTFELVEEGVLSGMSFAARITGEEWYETGKPGGMPHRVITEVSRLMDVCACTWPAYSKPSITTATRASADKSDRLMLHNYKPRLPDQTSLAAEPSRLSEWMKKGYRRTTKPKFAKKLPTRRGCGHMTEIGRHN